MKMIIDKEKIREEFLSSDIHDNSIHGFICI